MPSDTPGPASPESAGDTALRSQLTELLSAGWELWEEFDEGSVDRDFHPFVSADYDAVVRSLWPLKGCGGRFLEWGSATGVITVMAQMLGFEAYGIELDEELVVSARRLADRFDSSASFAAGSYLPEGYSWSAPNGDTRTGTVGSGPSGYLKLGLSLDEFDVVFGYPWDGEDSMMFDLMAQFGRADTLLLINSASHELKGYRAGKLVTPENWCS